MSSEAQSQEYYAIRERGTGKFLFQVKRGGQTHSYPVPPEVHPPRMFTSEHDANVALTWWLKGECYTTWEGRIDFNALSVADDGEQVLHERPVAERKRENMEVIPVYVAYDV